MPEYQVTVTVKRAARDVGDEPFVVASASGHKTVSYGEQYVADACWTALDEALTLVALILNRKGGRPEGWRPWDEPMQISGPAQEVSA